jgi:hypothetical protein
MLLVVTTTMIKEEEGVEPGIFRVTCPDPVSIVSMFEKHVW